MCAQFRPDLMASIVVGQTLFSSAILTAVLPICRSFQIFITFSSVNLALPLLLPFEELFLALSEPLLARVPHARFSNDRLFLFLVRKVPQ